MTPEEIAEYKAGLNPTEKMALSLLASGNISQEQVAKHIGVDPSRISQMMAEEGFRTVLAAERYARIAKRNSLDDLYDDLEWKAADKLKKMLPMVVKPREVMDLVKTINSAKRRGTGEGGGVVEAAKVVEITLPVAIMNKIVVDPATNKVIESNGQSMLTSPSTTILERFTSHGKLSNSAKAPSKRSPVSAEDL